MTSSSCRYVNSIDVVVMEENSEVRFDLKLCLVCQSKRDEPLVENPRSTRETLLNAIECRAGYGEMKYAEIWSLLKEVKPEEFESKEATWHRRCYQEATHSGMLKRSRERYDKFLFLLY